MRGYARILLSPFAIIQAIFSSLFQMFWPFFSLLLSEFLHTESVYRFRVLSLLVDVESTVNQSYQWIESRLNGLREPRVGLQQYVGYQAVE